MVLTCRPYSLSGASVTEVFNITYVRQWIELKYFLLSNSSVCTSGHFEHGRYSNRGSAYVQVAAHVSSGIDLLVVLFWVRVGLALVLGCARVAGDREWGAKAVGSIVEAASDGLEEALDRREAACGGSGHYRRLQRGEKGNGYQIKPKRKRTQMEEVRVDPALVTA